MTTLGQRIREHRRRAGMSQEALARQLDVSRQAVTKWESGQSAPSTENLFRLAELFHTTVDLLLPPGEASPAASARPRPDWRHRAEMAGLVLAGYLIFYLLGRVLWCPMEGSSLLGWLVWNRPDGDGSYLYGWLLSSGLFWWAMALSVLTALLGRYRLSLVTCAYFLLGFLTGFLLGPHPAGPYSNSQSSTTYRAATGVTSPRISLDSSDRIPGCEAVIPGISVRSPPLSTRMP